MSMKRVFKWFWVWEFEKEDMWLNSMAADGWTLCQIGWCTYWFERTDPGAYEVRLECRKPDEAYISFVKDTGAEYIGHMMQWLYFRRKSELGHFELNSDLELPDRTAQQHGPHPAAHRHPQPGHRAYEPALQWPGRYQPHLRRGSCLRLRPHPGQTG